jgi:hypothetical protein
MILISNHSDIEFMVANEIRIRLLAVLTVGLKKPEPYASPIKRSAWLSQRAHRNIEAARSRSLPEATGLS